MVQTKTLQRAKNHRERVRLVADSLGVDKATPKAVMEVLDRAETPASRAVVSKYLGEMRREAAPEPQATEPAEPQLEVTFPENVATPLAEPEPVETPANAPEALAEPTEAEETERKRVRIWPLWILYVSAFVAVWSGWVGLGSMTGFGEIQPLPGIADGFTINSAIALPIGVEAYSAYAMYVWLSGKAATRAIGFAKVSSIVALCIGGLGQVAYHVLAAAGVETAPWWVTAFISTVPVVVVGMAAALAHLANSHE
jgi:hypothetical protein